MDKDLMILLDLIFGGTGVLFCLIFQIHYSVGNVPLQVYLDGKEVYHGRSACVETASVGSSSRVDTKKGPWCLFPKEYFAGHNLVIETKR